MKNVRMAIWAVVMVVVVTVTAASAEIIFIDDYAGNNTDGRFVIEAENYSNRILGTSSGWWEVNGSTNTFTEGPSLGEIAPTDQSGARNNYIEILGSFTGGTAPTSSSYDGSFTDFNVSIQTVGSYNLFVRWAGHTYGSDSLYAYILKPDNTPLTGAGPDYFAYHDRNLNWEWERRGVKNTTGVSGVGFPDNATWTISQTGVYTVRIAGRENAAALDALIFQTTNLSAPIGIGPAQSQTIPEPATLILCGLGAVIVRKRK